jgi:hypothetical protein
MSAGATIVVRADSTSAGARSGARHRTYTNFSTARESNVGGIDVYLEVGSKRVFAGAVDWPGWSRSGKSEDLALEQLALYAPRYSVIAGEAGVRFPATAAAGLHVVERVKGSGATDFGVPGEVPDCDRRPLTRANAERQRKLVAASWAVLDRVVAGAPASLRKGPRGGGRDRDKIVDHVVEAEASYARELGVRMKVSSADEAILVVLGQVSDGAPLVKRWPSRYAARRIAWHVIDHAWEIEDRSDG